MESETPMLDQNIAHATDRPSSDRSDFWRSIPAWRDVGVDQFNDPMWQERNSVTSLSALSHMIEPLVERNFIEELAAGSERAAMSMRLTPYLLALIDWTRPLSDPVRRQFLPLLSEAEPDHPMLRFDSQNEHRDSPTPGLVHRYPDRALLIATDVCPVYCRFCTRSYTVGQDTKRVVKDHFSPTLARWKMAFDYIRATPQVIDIVVSGGDAYRLKPSQITEIGEGLLAIPHVRRIRFATKGIAVLPMKVTGDQPWIDAVSRLRDRAVRLHKEVCIHTHFNHPREVTEYTVSAAHILFERGITTRNQTALLRGVNDSAMTLQSLIRALSDLHIHPYYLFACDFVPGTEDMRLSLGDSIELDKQIRGITAGYNTPVTAVDLFGGGGKRNIHSFEVYDREIGLALYRSPNVASETLFPYVDPLRGLSPDIRRKWRDAKEARGMIDSVLKTVPGYPDRYRLVEFADKNSI